MEFPVLSVVYQYVAHPSEGEEHDVELLVFADHLVGRRLGWEFVRVRVDGGWLHVYPDAAYFFPDHAQEGVKVWEKSPNG